MEGVSERGSLAAEAVGEPSGHGIRKRKGHFEKAVLEIDA